MEETIMSVDLKIECEWWGSEDGDKDLSEACRGAIGIVVGEDCLTRLEDTLGNTVRNRVNASAYPLARWFAGNWWRLRWEPETQYSSRDVDWMLSHSMASAGEGYSWPNVLFASDGETLAVASRATRGKSMGPVRYLNEVNTRISAKAFESGVDAFLTLVLARLHGEGHRISDLAELWAEVLKERRDPELSRWRRLEALCGYDPDEAPKSTIEMLVEDRAQLGAKALEEVAAHGRHESAGAVTSIVELARATAKPATGGFRGTIPELKGRPKCHAADRPWQRATKLAQWARKEWGLGNGPMTNQQLADLLGTKAAAFTSRTKAPTPLPIMLKSGNGVSVDVYVDSEWATTRRFACSRLLGDFLAQSGDGRLIPATKAKTVRQAFQRAFAQEFLCPFEALLEKIQTTDPGEEDIVEAARYFDVSPLMVRTTLVNKGELDREVLSWAD